MKSIVFIIASNYELENRKPDEDFRRQFFAKKIELMEKLDPKFARWQKDEINKILDDHPYDDNDD